MVEFLTVEQLFETCKKMIDDGKNDYVVQYPDDTGVLNVTYSYVDNKDKTLQIGAN